MLIFPQLQTGASVQYPIRKRRSERTITNISQDGRITTLSDSNAKQLLWDLTFNELTDIEVANLSSFFQLCEGPLQPFLFLDPSGNLLTYSEDYTQPAWVYNALLSLATGIDDPLGTNRASRFTNNSGADLTITQTVGIPGSVQTAFSAYLRSAPGSAQANGVQLTRTDGSTVASQPANLTAGWTRFYLSTTFASSISSTCDFSITVPTGSALDIFGTQLEAQPNPGTYVSSIDESGVFPNSRFNSNSIAVTATGPGQSRVVLSVLSRAGE